MSKPLPHLMSPGRIGTLELRNRIIMSPMGSNLAEEGGYCGERSQSYFEARARGGAGMIIMGSVSVAWPEGTANPRHLAISDDRFIPGLGRLCERVHAHGCRIVPQLQHAGPGAVDDSGSGRALLCPSTPHPKGNDMAPDLSPAEIGEMSEPYRRDGARVHYREAQQEDIDWLIARFVDAAQRARRAGFDGVEVHGGHGYILSSFLNPSVNRRTDRYGGPLENRARLLIEVLQAIRARLGPDFPLWCRLDSVEFLTPGGISHEDARDVARMAVAAGANAIHCSAYGDAGRGISYSEAHATHHPQRFVPYAASIRAAIDVPVIVPGRIEPEAADALIGAGRIDFVAMARKLLADPELPNKIREQRAEHIRPCIYCYVCISQIFLRRNLKCAVNAATGHEAERLIQPAPKPGRVLVVGGGPAGLEAARVARLRGHEVILCEREKRLGGTAWLSAISYEPNGRLVDYLVRQVRELGVQIRLGTEVSGSELGSIRPDSIVVAIGAGREAPSIPGADLDHVLDGDDFRELMAGRVGGRLAKRLGPYTRFAMRCASMLRLMDSPRLTRMLSHLFMPLGRRIVMIGGGLVAVELAEFLARRGRSVTILERGSVFGQELSLVRRWRNLHDIRQLGVECIGETTVKCIEPGHVTHVNAGGQERRIAADTVIITSGTTANTSLGERLQASGIPTLSIGDCAGMAYLEGAMHQGFLAGSRV